MPTLAVRLLPLVPVSPCRPPPSHSASAWPRRLRSHPRASAARCSSSRAIPTPSAPTSTTSACRTAARSRGRDSHRGLRCPAREPRHPGLWRGYSGSRPTAPSARTDASRFAASRRSCHKEMIARPTVEASPRKRARLLDLFGGRGVGGLTAVGSPFLKAAFVYLSPSLEIFVVPARVPRYDGGRASLLPSKCRSCPRWYGWPLGSVAAECDFEAFSARIGDLPGALELAGTKTSEGGHGQGESCHEDGSGEF